MEVTFQNLQSMPASRQTASPPAPLPASGPVLMADILVAPLGRPELLWRWERDLQADRDQP